jgi:hypothetical protein
MFHLVGPTTFEGMLGVPFIHQMRDLIGLELEVTEFVTRFFAQGAVPGGVLKMPGRLSPEASKRLRDAWQAAHGGASRAGRVAVLEDGLTYEPITPTARDNELIEMRKYCRQQIAAAMGVPAHKVGDTESQSYSSNEQADAEFVKHTLAGWAARLEQEASRKLLQRGERYCTRINFDSLLRADMSTRYAAYAVAVTNGILTPNEIRAREGLPAVEGGDSIRLPMNTEAPGQPAPAPSQPAAPSDGVPPSVDVEPEAVAASVDLDAQDEAYSSARAAASAMAAVRPAVEGAFRRHLQRVSDYLLKQRTQSKLDKWEPPIDCIDDDLRATVRTLGGLLGNEERATKALDAALLRHARHLRSAVTAIGTLSETIDGWRDLPQLAADELLEMVRLETTHAPLLETTNVNPEA